MDTSEESVISFYTGYSGMTKQEKNREYQRRYRERHPEKAKAACRKYYQKNRQRELERARKKFQIFKGNGYSDSRRIYQVNRFHKKRSQTTQPPLRKSEWKEILELSGNKCVRCDSGEDLTMDHIISIAKGGQHTKKNIQVLCRSCNSSKGVN